MAELERGTETPCLWCGAITRRPDRHCVHCAYFIRTAKTYKPQPTDALQGGTWVPRGGVYVWQEAS